MTTSALIATRKLSILDLFIAGTIIVDVGEKEKGREPEREREREREGEICIADHEVIRNVTFSSL